MHSVPFNQAAFEDGIRLAMAVGLPPIEAERPVFVFTNSTVNTAPADAEHVPFDPAATPAVTPGRRVAGIYCAIEYQDAAGQLVNLGVITPSQIVVTLLDDEYRQVEGFDYVEIAGDRYFYRRTEPTIGLADSQIWRIHCRAEDDK